MTHHRGVIDWTLKPKMDLYFLRFPSNYSTIGVGPGWSCHLSRVRTISGVVLAHKCLS
jgi:hypothetical protein